MMVRHPSEANRPWPEAVLVEVGIISMTIRFDGKEAPVDYLHSAASVMDRIQQRLAALRAEADQAIEPAEEAERKVKECEQGILERDQEIASLQHKTLSLEEQCDRVTRRLGEVEERVVASDLEIERMTRQVNYAEQQRDKMQAKYEEMLAKYKASQAELDDLLSNLANI
ncbi:hypothetical protein EDD17DRAFT_361588 [Pisolithus thermaeus]|nr:hypothetical protein EDD17DRAFT_361588 [Pisolithus thermaeus]